MLRSTFKDVPEFRFSPNKMYWLTVKTIIKGTLHFGVFVRRLLVAPAQSTQSTFSGCNIKFPNVVGCHRFWHLARTNIKNLSFLTNKKKLEKNRQKEMEEEGTKNNSSMRQKRVWRKSLGKIKIIRFISFVRSLVVASGFSFPLVIRLLVSWVEGYHISYRFNVDMLKKIFYLPTYNRLKLV